MSDEKMINAFETSARMKELVEALFSLPEDMRERAVDALYQLVGPSSAEQRADEEEEREKRDAYDRELLNLKATLIAQLSQGFFAYLQRPVEAYPPPPPAEPLHAHANADMKRLLNLNTLQKQQIVDALSPDQVALLDAMFPGILLPH